MLLHRNVVQHARLLRLGGGAEAIMAQLADPLEDGALTDVELAALDPPELEGLFRYGRLVKALRPAPGTVDAR